MNNQNYNVNCYFLNYRIILVSFGDMAFLPEPKILAKQSFSKFSSKAIFLIKVHTFLTNYYY